MEFIVRNTWGGSVRFENGVECKATENNVSKLTDAIFNQMPPTILFSRATTPLRESGRLKFIPG